MPRELLISFDADQTLFDFQRILDEALITTASFLSHYSEKPITPRRLKRIHKAFVEDADPNNIRLLEIRRASFEQALNPLSNAKELSEQALEIFKRVRFGDPYFYPHVKETLATLKRNYKTALITNGNSCPKSAGIAHLFDFVVMAEEYPYRKPDPRLFDAMLSMAGMSPTNSFMSEILWNTTSQVQTISAPHPSGLILFITTTALLSCQIIPSPA